MPIQLLSYFNLAQYFSINFFLGNFLFFYNYYLQGPTENRQGEWAPWINIIIIVLM